MIFIDSNIVQSLIGKLFRDGGVRYEGKWKDDKMLGGGKRSDLLYDFNIVQCSDCKIY